MGFPSFFHLYMFWLSSSCHLCFSVGETWIKTISIVWTEFKTQDHLQEWVARCTDNREGLGLGRTTSCARLALPVLECFTNLSKSGTWILSFLKMRFSEFVSHKFVRCFKLVIFNYCWFNLETAGSFLQKAGTAVLWHEWSLMDDRNAPADLLLAQPLN